MSKSGPGMLHVEIDYWSDDADGPQQFSQLLSVLKTTFSYNISLRAMKQSGFNMEMSGSNPAKPVANIFWKLKNSSSPFTRENETVLKDTINAFWQDKYYIQSVQNFQADPDSGIRGVEIHTTELDPHDNMVKTRKEYEVYVTVTTWKMTGPKVTSDVWAKITSKITAEPSFKSLPTAVIFQVKNEEGYCELLEGKVSKKIVPVVQVQIETRGIYVDPSFDLEVHSIVSKVYPYPDYFVRVLRLE